MSVKCGDVWCMIQRFLLYDTVTPGEKYSRVMSRCVVYETVTGVAEVYAANVVNTEELSV